MAACEIHERTKYYWHIRCKAISKSVWGKFGLAAVVVEGVAYVYPLDRMTRCSRIKGVGQRDL